MDEHEMDGHEDYLHMRLHELYLQWKAAQEAAEREEEERPERKSA